LARIFRITIDWDRLAASLSREHGQPQSRGQIESWLRAAGFTAEADGIHWRVHESDLGHLDPSEVLTAEAVGEE